MIIQALAGSSMTTLLELERYVNEGSPSGLSFGEHQVAEAYAPRSPRPCFDVPWCEIPVGVAEVIQAQPSVELLDLAVHAGAVRLYLHPQCADEAPTAIVAHLPVAPTASARTVAMLGSPRCFLKLHYRGLLGRVPREMTRLRVRASCRMSAELDVMARAGRIPEQTAYLPESIGVATDGPRGELGYVVREAVPRPLSPGGDAPLVPFFALFARDLLRPDDPTLLDQMVASTGISPRELAVDRIVLPLLRSYAGLVVRAGLLPEYHGQNVLLELDAGLLPTRIVLRDLLDWMADLQLRRELGLSTDFYRALDIDTRPAHARHTRSYAFDFRIGRYILDPLAQWLAATGGIDRETVTALFRDSFLTVAEEMKFDVRSYFQPYDMVCSYPSGRLDYGSGGPRYVVASGPVYR